MLKNYPDTSTPLNNKSIIDLIYPIGIYVEISDTNFNPNTYWGGTWILEEDGTVLSSKCSVNGSLLNTDVGSIVGEDKHTMTLAELVSHYHTKTVIPKDADWITPNGGWNYSFTSGSTYSQNTDSTGGGQPFNIIQKTKIVNRWHRTA